MKKKSSTNNTENTGKLYIIATPIGNLEDITFRAISTLKQVDIIFAEDTRHSLPLLSKYGISKKTCALHDHNENQKIPEILTLLEEGKNIAIISDAGTPLISDPGFSIVSQARKSGIEVVPIPGACALITAISAAGIACDTFTFAGFLPAKRLARQKRLQALGAISHTIVFYESKHRLLDALDDIETVFQADTEVVVAKELTKTFENFIEGHCQSIKEWFLADTERQNGEFVILIKPRVALKDDSYLETLSKLLKELPVKTAVQLTSDIYNLPKNSIYKKALSLTNDDIES